ncbi:hypothetical protein A2U01_0074784, partial [Trifolium medium]|nr:hypothetical protein [Trifolium medium]
VWIYTRPVCGGGRGSVTSWFLCLVPWICWLELFERSLVVADLLCYRHLLFSFFRRR